MVSIEFLRSISNLIAWVGVAYIGAVFGIMFAGFTISHIMAVTLRADERR